MPAHARVSGVWQEIAEIHARVAGVWQEIQEGWVKDGGVWEQFHNASLLVDPGLQSYINITGGSGTARSGIRVATDGDLDEIDYPFIYTDRDDWYLAGANSSDYEVEVIVNSGTLTSGTTGSGNWQSLSTSRTWYCETNGGIQQANLTFTIRHATRTSDSISFTVTLYADDSPI